MEAPTINELREMAEQINEVTGWDETPEPLYIEHYAHAGTGRTYRAMRGGRYMWTGGSKAELMGKLKAYYMGVVYGRQYEMETRPEVD